MYWDRRTPNFYLQKKFVKSFLCSTEFEIRDVSLHVSNSNTCVHKFIHKITLFLFSIKTDDIVAMELLLLLLLQFSYSIYLCSIKEQKTQQQIESSINAFWRKLLLRMSFRWVNVLVHLTFRCLFLSLAKAFEYLIECLISMTSCKCNIRFKLEKYVSIVNSARGACYSKRTKECHCFD